jgi:hypothetical protein
VGPRASLNDMVKQKFLPPPGLELRSLGRPASSQSLYRLRYLGSLLRSITVIRRLFHPEDEGSAFLRNGDITLQDYTVSLPIRPKSGELRV